MIEAKDHHDDAAGRSPARAALMAAEQAEVTRYRARGENRPGGGATIESHASKIMFDGSAETGGLLPGPADLLAAALAACMLKNVERFAGILPFRYRQAQIEVEVERAEPPPRIVRAHYTLTIATDEPRPPARPVAPQHSPLRHDHQHPGSRLRALRHDPRRTAAATRKERR